MEEHTRKNFSVVFGALFIILIASLLFIARDLETTTYGWFIASLIMGGLCGISFNIKSLAKITGIFLMTIFMTSIVVVILTRDYWLHTCFGGLVPFILLLAPPLAAAVGIIIGSLIMYTAKSVNFPIQKEENNQNSETQE
ncbi:MAG: hypothetical protein H7641_07180 [Candidatus Heimdallarchaeota archaeon]|nr:hypothetical protein [Candidatus Heimdallarchaeota archaeon]MCK4877347.1 hypothetical protein [Candidatus Heimdallarchaeota archaeon]